MDKLEQASWATLMAGAAASMPGEHPDAGEWAARVAERAAALARAMGRASELAMVASTHKTFDGRVVAVANPAVSEAGKVLGFANVHLQADVGTRPDFLWVDITNDAGAALAAKAADLVGHRVRFARHNEPQMRGGEVVLDDKGEPVTRPRLVSIEAIPGPGPGVPAPAPAVAAVPDVPAPAGPGPAPDVPAPAGPGPAPDVPAPAGPVPAPDRGGRAATYAAPGSNRELMERAAALGWKVAEVRAVSEEILGPLVTVAGTAQARTSEELAVLWAELVRRAVNGAA